MLKKGKKAFKPKNPSVRRSDAPPSTASSTRPSTEPQQQSPAPGSQPTDTIPVSQNVEPSSDTRAEASNSESQDSQRLPAGIEISPATQECVEQARNHMKRLGGEFEGDQHGENQNGQPASKIRKLDHQASRDVAMTETVRAQSPEASQQSNHQIRPEESQNTEHRCEPSQVTSSAASITQPNEDSVAPASAMDTQISTQTSRESEPSVSSRNAPLEPRSEVTETETGTSATIQASDNNVASGEAEAGLGRNEDSTRTATSTATAEAEQNTTAQEVPSQIPESQPETSVPSAEEETATPSSTEQAEAGDKVRPTTETPADRPQRPRKSRKRKDGQPAKKRKQRAETPEGAEEERIDQSKIKMLELCTDIKIGKKFSRHAELRKRRAERRAKASLSKKHPEVAAMVEGQEGTAQTQPQREQAAEAETPVTRGTRPRMRMVNGQIIIDQGTLQVNRQQQAAAENVIMEEVVEEDEFTHLVTSGTYLKREKNNRWDQAADELFYKGLRQWGTDFEMISKMFPERSRKQIKLHFTAEEKKWPANIARALTGVKEEIDMVEYAQMTGLKYEEVDDIKAQQRRLEEQQKAEEARIDAERAEITRQKRDSIRQRAETARRVMAQVSDSEEEVGREREAGGGGNIGESGRRTTAERNTAERPCTAGDSSAKENEVRGAKGATRNPTTNANGNANAASTAKQNAAAKSKANEKSKAAGKKKKKQMPANRYGGDEVEVLGVVDR